MRGRIDAYGHLRRVAVWTQDTALRLREKFGGHTMCRAHPDRRGRIRHDRRTNVLTIDDDKPLETRGMKPMDRMPLPDEAEKLNLTNKLTIFRMEHVPAAGRGLLAGSTASTAELLRRGDLLYRGHDGYRGRYIARSALVTNFGNAHGPHRGQLLFCSAFT